MIQVVVGEPCGPEVLSLQEAEQPDPGSGQVRIKVAYASLNPLDNHARADRIKWNHPGYHFTCLLYTSPSPRDRTRSRMPSSA